LETRNPHFNIKEWCLDNNILYEEEWNYFSDCLIEQEVENRLLQAENFELIDELHEAHYLYDLRHIELWFRDNNIPYNTNLNNWENLNKLWIFLNFPKNINLLSKFWKDGVGSFAFVREEVIQKKIHIILG
jgi:hypothetical protein